MRSVTHTLNTHVRSGKLKNQIKSSFISVIAHLEDDLKSRNLYKNYIDGYNSKHF